VEVGGNGIGDDAMMDISECIKVIHNCHNFVCHIIIHSLCVLWLAVCVSVCQVNRSIEVLYLNVNRIGWLGMKFLAPSLAVSCDEVLCTLCCVPCLEVLQRFTVESSLMCF